MNRRLRSLLTPVIATAALAGSNALIAQDAPIPTAPTNIEVEVGRDDNVVRDLEDYGSLNVNLSGWDLGFAYSKEAPSYLEQRDKFSLGIAKDFGYQRFNAAVLQESVGGSTNLGGMASWEYGEKDAQRFGFDGAYLQRQFNEFSIPEAAQSHVRVHYGLRNGTEFSAFMNNNATPDMMGDQKSFTRLPRSTLGGQQTLADWNVGEDLIENSVGASVSFSREKRDGTVYVKQGEQYIKGIPTPDKFQAYGGTFNDRGRIFSGKLDLDIRDAKTIDSQYHEARLFFDGVAKLGGAELGFGAYSHGISTELPQTLIGFYDTAGAGAHFTGRVGKNGRAGAWVMAEDNAPHAHTIFRGGVFFGRGAYEFGVGARLDDKGMARFATQEQGYFITVQTPHGGGLIGVQDGEPYGDLSLSLRRKQTQENRLPFLGTENETVSLLPTNYQMTPDFLTSNASLDFGNERHTGSVFSKQSSIKMANQDAVLATKEVGVRHQFSGEKIAFDASVAVSQIPSLGISQPVGSVAGVYTIGKTGIGLGVVKDQQLFTGERNANFAFWRRNFGNILLENAVGMQNNSPFVSLHVGLQSGAAPVLPAYLLPPLPMRAIMSAVSDGIYVPGPERLDINVHNGGLWSANQELPLLRQIKAGITGVRINPMYVCTHNDPPSDACTGVVPYDPYLKGVLDLFGPEGVIVLIARDLGPKPIDQFTPQQMYMRMKNVLLSDNRIVNVQCGGEMLNAENATPEQVARKYGPACRQAADEVNLIRPANLKVFLLDDGAFGSRSGIQGKERETRAGASQYFDGITCHIYTDSIDEAVLRARECKALAHGKPVSITESNYANGSEFSRYDKHAFWFEKVMPAMERVLEKDLPEHLRAKQFNVFYTLRAHEVAQFNFMEWSESLQRLVPTRSGVYDLIMQRVAAANAQSAVAAATQTPIPVTAADAAWRDATRHYPLDDRRERLPDKQ